MRPYPHDSKLLSQLVLVGIQLQLVQVGRPIRAARLGSTLALAVHVSKQLARHIQQLLQQLLQCLTKYHDTGHDLGMIWAP